MTGIGEGVVRPPSPKFAAGGIRTPTDRWYTSLAIRRVYQFHHGGMDIRGWQVSNLRHRDLRSRVLPLNYTPIFSRARTADSWRAGSPRRSHGISEDSDIGPYLRCRDVGRPHEHGNSTVIKVHVQHSSAARNRLLERHATEYPIWHRSSNELSENRDNFPT